MDAETRWTDRLFEEDSKRHHEPVRLDDICMICHQVYDWDEGDESPFVKECLAHDDCKIDMCRFCYENHERK